MLLIPADFDIAERTIYAEARGDGPEGRRAVAHVLVNRWQSKAGQWAKDDTLATVCLRHLQFSAWTVSDPNFEKLFRVTVMDEIFLDCGIQIRAVLTGSKDPTLGSRHYHTRAIEPHWIKLGHGKTRKPCYETKGHLFYNDVP